MKDEALRVSCSVRSVYVFTGVPVYMLTPALPTQADHSMVS
jgi:hypothetical protein